jgi:vancomycin resistance protein YoaR
MFIPHRVEYTSSPVNNTLIHNNIHQILPKIQDFTIQPGETWSFNKAVGHPDQYKLDTVYNVYGGGWCDIASRIAEVARKQGLDLEFQLHSTPLIGVERQDNVSIWNEDGSAEQKQDLRITNKKSYPITFRVSSEEMNYQVQSFYSRPLFLRASLFTMP